MNIYQKWKYKFCNEEEAEQQMNVLVKSVDDLNDILRQKDKMIDKQNELLQIRDDQVNSCDYI